MAKYKIKVLQIAQDDMKSIVAHIHLDNPDAAVRMVAKIQDSIARLADHPLMGPIPHDKKIAAQGYRMIVVEPYLVFYVVVSDERTIEIHRVIHGRRQYSAVLSTP